MKKIFAVLAVAALLSGCASPKTFEGVTAQPYGLANQSVKKLNGVSYQISFFNVVVGIIFIETIIVPIYIIGWDLYEPVSFVGTKDCDGEFSPVACNKLPVR